MQISQEAMFAAYGRACVELDQLRAQAVRQQKRIDELETANADLSAALRNASANDDEA